MIEDQTAARLPRGGPATWQVVLIALLAAVSFRWLVTSMADLTPADLQHFETASGIDLPDRYGELPFFLLWTRGDGQTFVSLAVDPLIQGPSKRLEATDIRLSRLGYSLLGRVLVAGRTDLVPVGLLVASAMGIALYAACTARLARVHGPRLWWLLANPPLLIGFASDTAETLGLALALAAITSVSLAWTTVSAFLLGTVRPELVATLGAGRHPLTSLIAGAIAGVGLQVYAILRVGTDLRSGMNFSVPPMGYVAALPELALVDQVAAGGVLVAAAATIGYGLIRRPGWARVAWVLYGLVIASLSAKVIHSGANVIRVSGGLVLLWLVPVWSHEPVRSSVRRVLRH